MAEIPTEDQWLTAALRSIGDPIIIADPAWQIVWMNQAAETLTGFRPDGARKQPLADVLPLLDEATGLPSAVVPDRSPASTYIFRGAGVPDRPLEVTCCRITVSPGTTGFLLICRDLTAKRERESLLVRSERLDAISGLAGGVGHDLNNYLTIINGYTEELRLMNEGGDQTPLEEISQASQAAAGMTRNLMTLARRSPNQPEVFVLGDLVAEMGGAISRLLGGKRTLRLAEDPAKAKVQADRTLLKQVLTALAVFARDAKSSGGEFSIEAGSVETLERGPCARLLVSLVGETMEPQALARIFEPLCTSRPVAFAHGLGLAQAQAIIAQCGGFIRALSSGGRLTFEILLPQVYQLLSHEEEGAPVRPGGDDTRITVLLVEDDASVRRIVHNYVERAGFNLLEAGNAEEAVHLAEVLKDPIHVLVTDVVLPGMSGRELADKLKASRPGLKVLLVSGFPRNTLVHTGAATGHRFLPKPFTAADLLECIRGLAHEEVEQARTL